MMHIIKGCLCHLFLALLGLVPGMVQAECIAGGTSQRHVAYRTTVDLQLSPGTKARDYLGSYDFTMDSSNSHIANCDPGSDIYAYATYSEGSGIKANFFDTIDGRPTYFATATTLSAYQKYAYALELIDDGAYFTSQGTRLSRSGQLTGPLVRMHFYAAKDNPGEYEVSKLVIGAILLSPFNPGGGSTGAGFTYLLTTKIKAAPASCIVDTDNLVFRMPAIPAGAFPDYGTPPEQYSETQNLQVSCEGQSQFALSMSLQSAHGTASINGEQALLKIEDEGGVGRAEGVGYVLSAPYVDGSAYLLENSYRDIAYGVQQGGALIPIKAQYFRYGNNVRPGIANTSAQFTLEFR